MKITTGMVEAGISALDRINRTKQSAEAVVSAVYSAMESIRTREAAMTPTSEKAAYIHQAWPSVRYGPDGQRKVCQSEADVPEGWADSPDFVAAAGDAKTMADIMDGGLEELRTQYTARFGQKPHHRMSVASLREKLAA